MKTYAIVATILSAMFLCSYVAYRLGQSNGFEMGFTQGLFSFAKTADEQRKQANGDVLFLNVEWPDTLRGLSNLREKSGAADFISWKSNPASYLQVVALPQTPAFTIHR
jgi:hypothetical protein